MWNLLRFGEIIWGWGSLSYLSTLKGKRALITTTRGKLRELGFVDKVKEYLSKGFEKVEVFEGIEPNPKVSSVMKLYKFIKEYKPDTIIALGGGSVIDATKAACILYEKPSLTLEEVIKDSSLVPRIGTKVKLIAVPSTSGSGSEVSRGCVITDDKTNIKYAIVSINLVPSLAILDPELPLHMPKNLTADSGIDALSHAIESYTSIKANDFTKPLSLNAIILIWNYLRRAYGNPNDREAREKMHYAQCMAALAFTNAGTGAIHAISHVISMYLGLSHGRTNAILMPYVVFYNAQTNPEPYVDIAYSLGYETSEDDVAYELAYALLDYNRKLDLPESFSEVTTISESELIEHVKKYMKLIIESAPMKTNPRKLTPDDVVKILKMAWSGEIG